MVGNRSRIDWHNAVCVFEGIHRKGFGSGTYPGLRVLHVGGDKSDSAVGEMPPQNWQS